MAEKMIKCAKLGKELPAIDEDTNEGEQALKMCLLIGGRAWADRVRENISADAWAQWIDHQVMVVNEYRLDPTSDASNAILHRHMESFFFGEQMQVDNYVPPEQSKP